MNADYILIIYFTLISKRRKVKRTELAARAGVSTRTVSRCIDALTLAGVPVYSETGAEGGYYIPDDYVLSKAAFSAEEKARIINCIHAAKDSFQDDLCARILDKFSGLSYADPDYAIKSDTLVIDAAGWNSPIASSHKFALLAKAVDEKTTVRMTYTDRYEYDSERLFDPYCLVLKGGLWYVYGWCHRRDDFRLFKIARIKDISFTPDTFTRRPSDVYAKLRGDFSRDDLVRFTIEFDNLILPEIEEWLGADSIEDCGNAYRATAELFGGNILVGKLLSFGSSVTVLSPEPLREELVTETKRMLNKYI
ncbi:MAG: YafY family transcriptional regulator [Clostridiales bacterium]|nr:YafY family transcriptional regulator [Clostridiales bacterium]